MSVGHHVLSKGFFLNAVFVAGRNFLPFHCPYERPREIKGGRSPLYERVPLPLLLCFGLDDYALHLLSIHHELSSSSSRGVAFCWLHYYSHRRQLRSVEDMMTDGYGYHHASKTSLLDHHNVLLLDYPRRRLLFFHEILDFPLMPIQVDVGGGIVGVGVFVVSLCKL